MYKSKTINQRSKSCFLFDVDGTLTEARQEMSSEFEDFFKSWMGNKKVYLVSGSDLPKIKEQIPVDILYKCDGVFTSMGNEYWKFKRTRVIGVFKEECVYQKELDLPDEIEDWLSSKLESSTFEYRKAPHFEYRSGALNFSVVGRGANTNLRQYYSEWDETNKERETIAKQFNKKFKNKHGIQALVGGQISLDIQPVGNDKGQVVNHVKGDEIIFFGDRCYEGGNDYSLAQKADTFWQVNSWKETKQILESDYK